MKFLSLFSGIGGLDLGLERAGWECVGVAEFNEDCAAWLADRWPGLRRWKDVNEIDPADVPVCDAIVGGFPCQPHSAIGKRAGADDERNLWPAYLRLVRALRPWIVIGENVRGIDNTMLAVVVGDLEAAGYEVGVLGVEAAAVGAPHARERRFIVAVADRGGARLEGHAGDGDGGDEPGRLAAAPGGSTGEGGLPAGGGWERVMFQAECDPDGDGWCRVRDCDPSECDCIGPTQDGIEYFEHPVTGELWGRPEGAGGSQSGLGGVPDGVPAWLAGPGAWGDWPAGPGEPQRGWEPPRVARGVLGRRQRLTALGNAVVPQVGALVGMAVLELLRKRGLL